MFQLNRYIFWPGEQMPLAKFVSEYRRLYQEAADLFAEFDPCAVQDGVCFRGRQPLQENFCCKNCDYITEIGCNAKSLYCRLWICGTLITDSVLPEEFTVRLAKLKIAARPLCRSIHERLDISDYIKRFYSKKEHALWLAKATKLKSNSISSSSGSQS